MDLEQLRKQKERYLDKVNYFKSIAFGNLAADFQSMVDLITEMEEYIKERENGKEV